MNELASQRSKEGLDVYDELASERKEGERRRERPTTMGGEEWLYEWLYRWLYKWLYKWLSELLCDQTFTLF